MDFLQMLNDFFTKFDNILWGVPMIVILLGAHIYMTVRTKFVQRKTFKAIKLSVTKDPDSDGDISPFQALTTALASTIGTGNIIGVGTAIALGGAGAVLWCWISGVFGIATKYAESLIAVKYRVKTRDGKMRGGAMYAIENGVSKKTGINFKWVAYCLRCLRCLLHSALAAVFKQMRLQRLWIQPLILTKHICSTSSEWIFRLLRLFRVL